MTSYQNNLENPASASRFIATASNPANHQNIRINTSLIRNSKCILCLQYILKDFDGKPVWRSSAERQQVLFLY
jgi:hypothetical protein